ncbi:MAG TPA: hypothetical protein VKD26_13065 [Streptosporangiaceae bacterium]|nr:hypothetical protein [Streptosporangiaceae bacterium]
MSLMTQHCPECREDRLFERPHGAAECPDRACGPDGLCPELACVECGTALLFGFAIPVTVGTRLVTVPGRHSPGRAA